MDYFRNSRNGDYRKHRPNREYTPDNQGRSELQSSRSNFENLNGNGDRHSQRTRSVDGMVNGSGPRNPPLGSSNVFYGYGGPFRLDDDMDGSSEMGSSMDFKIQPWMDKITGGTFKRNYIDRVSFRPSLHHDPQSRMDDIRQFRSKESLSELDYKQSQSRTIVTILCVILGIILIGGIAGALAYFLSQEGSEDTSIKYYVATGEMSLNEIFYEELSNSSSQEFQNLSSIFCSAITEALQNSTENGDKYRLCEVIEFRNGSIKVRFKVYYVYTATVIITDETVNKDLNNSLTSKDANLAQLSTLVIIKMTLKITVEVETFQKENDPVATSLSPSTTPPTTIEATTITTPESTPTSTVPSTDTTTATEVSSTETDESTTDSETPESSSDTTLSTEGFTLPTETTESTVPQTTKTESTTERKIPETTQTESTIQLSTETESTTESTIPVTTNIESTTESTKLVTTEKESTILMTTQTESTTESIILATTKTEATTESTIPMTTKKESATESTTPETTKLESTPESTLPVTTQTENTTESTIAVNTRTESTIPVTTQTESTILVTTQTKSTIPVTTQTESTIPVTTQTETTPESTKPVTTQTERTIPVTTQTESTTERTIPVTTKTERTIPVTTQTERTIPVTTQTESTIPMTTQTERTIPVTTQTESTIPVNTQTERTIPVTTLTESTISMTIQTESTTESTIPVTTQTESAIPVTTQTKSTIPVVTQTKSTISVTTKTESTTENTTPVTINTGIAAESTTPVIIKTTESSTENTNPTTKSTKTIAVTDTTPSTERTLMTASGTKSTVDSTKQTTRNTFISSTESTTKITSSTVTNAEESTTESTTDKMSPTTMTTGYTNNSTPAIQATSGTQESTQCGGCTSVSIIGSTKDSIINNTIPTTHEITSSAFVEFTADVTVPNVFGIIGEITTLEACHVTPRGDWLYVSISIDYSGSSHVIEKFHANKTTEKPAYVDKFNTSTDMVGNNIIVIMTLNLTTLTADTCSWDGRYAVSCFATMNDTLNTKISNGSQISITAPMSEISIDSELQYSEGDQLTFNCSTKVDPNYSDIYVEFIKDSNRIGDMPGPRFGTDRNTDCTVDFNWAASSIRLTPMENGVIVRCVVKNTLLNKTKIAEKKLNVSSADVAFTKYSYRNLTNTFQEIECIARSASSVLDSLTIFKDDVPIAAVDSSGIVTKLVSSTRHSASTQSYADDVRLIVRISNVECKDEGTYRCTMIKKDNSTRTSPVMSFIVEGAKPTLTLHPDIFEPFARVGLNHVCSTEHTGKEESQKYLEVQVFKPNTFSGFRYSRRIAEAEKIFDPKNNITYINITGTTAQFLLVSDWKSNSSCNNKETITFLLDLTMEFNNGTVKCVLKDDMNEYSSIESRLIVIPGNFCDGYDDKSIRKHPSNNCSSYVDCTEINGKMYAVGNACPLGQCMNFLLKYCVPCDKSFTCDELTTPGPTTTLTTLPPGIKYLSCNDSTHSVGTTGLVKCVVYDKSFSTLQISFFPETNPGIEENIGEIFSNGSIRSQARPDVTFITDFVSSPMILSIRFQIVNCDQKGQYKITATGTNSSYAPSVEAFEMNVIGNLTTFEMQTKNVYQEGTQIDFNCTASLDESHASIKGYYKRQTESTFSEIEGSTTILERNRSYCYVKAVWRPVSQMIADVSLNNTHLKCEILKWPFAFQSKTFIVISADVAFNTYKIESSIGNTVSASCIARNVNSLKEILIRKMGNSNNITFASISFPNTVSNVNGVTVSYTNNSLSITIPQLDCWDEGYYDCIALQTDNTEVVAPAQLHIQPRNPPKNLPVILKMDIDINEYRYLPARFHSCTADVGYPENEGYLSLTFTHPETNANYTYDKKTITESMKRTLASPYKFSVNLASGLNIIILEDREPEIVNCTREKTVKFLLDITRKWNKAVVTCSVKSGNDEIRATIAEEEIYVIPKSICDGVNGSGTYLPHEKVDNCKSFIQCDRNVPIGSVCGDRLCFNHAKDECDWCERFVCDSEITTTQGSTESTSTSLIQSTTPALICPFESCTSDSVFEGETATISCGMNTSAAYEMINVMKNSDTLLNIFPNNTVSFNVDNSNNKFEYSVGVSLTFTIRNVSCSDISTYTFLLVSKDWRSCSESVSLNLKVKPKTPVLKIDYTWEVGKISSNHKCSGNVGNPAGSLSLEIRNGTTGDFASYVPASQSRDPNTIQNCSNHQTLRFSLDFSANNLTGYHIRCVANNDYTLESSETSPVSNVVNINPLEAHPCNRPDGQYPYPGICHLYLNCAQNITYVQFCGDLCFKQTTNSSGYCG